MSNASPLRASFTTRHLVTCLAGFGALALAAAPAVAEPRNGPPRYGTTFGFGLGVGHLACEDADGNDCGGPGNLPAGGLSVRVGQLIGPGSEVSGELWGMTHSEDAGSVSQVILAGQFRGWVVPRLWLQGGLGIARSSSEYNTGVGTIYSESDIVPAAVVGVGTEIVSDPGFAVDLELKAGAGLYQDNICIFNVSMGVGVSFY